MIGKTLSHYTILEELGRGGMGIVYKAEDMNLGRVVALKVLPTHLVSEEDQARFRREAQSAASLNHPNIATIHDFGETDDGQAFLVMELIEGESLSDRIDIGEVDAETAVDFVTQIAAGLQAAHKKGIVHRDVKPSNMMLTEDGRVKILDFGLAKMTGGVDITKTGLTVGTMSYMSPEQVQNEPVDERTDLWSLGVLFYEMLMGRRPFEGVYDAAIIYGIVNQDVELEDARIPEALCPILARLLEKNQGKRFASATELLEALGGGSQAPSGLVGSFVETTPSAPGIAMPSSTSVRMPSVFGRTMPGWMVPVAAFMVILLTVVVWRSLLPASIPKVGVMYFDNATPYDRLGEQVGRLLYRNLLQAEVDVVSRTTLAGILTQQFGADAQRIDAGTARPIAREAGISQMILGTASRPGAELVFDVELADVASGVVREAFSATAGSSADEDVFNTVNELTTGILRSLGVIGSDEIGPRVQNVMTESYSAYDLYEKGLNEAENWRFDPAMDYFRQAIAVDSTFFAAYLQAVLSSEEFFSSNPVGSMKEPLEFMRLAEKNISHATEMERAIYGVLSRLLTFDEGTRADTDFRALADRYRDEKNLQLLAANHGPMEGASPYLTRLFELDPGYADGYLLKAYMGILTGNHQEAVSAVRSYQSRLPEGRNSVDAAWEVMTGAGEEEEAITMLNQALEDFPGDSFEHRYNYVRLAYTKAIAGDTTGISAVIDTIYAHPPYRGYSGLFAESNIDLMLGSWDRALELSLENLGIARQSVSDNRVLQILRNHGAVLHAMGLHDEAESVLEEAVEISRRVFEDDFNPYPVLAAYQNGLGYADAGNKEKLIDAIAKIDGALEAPGMDGRHSAYRHLLAAHLAVIEGDADRAVENLDRMLETQKWSSHFFRLQAEILRLQGDVQGALGRYHLVEHNIAARTFGIAAYPSFFIDHALVPYDIARMFDDLGNREEAVRRYEAALATWESVGAEFRYVDIVRTRLEELNSGG